MHIDTLFGLPAHPLLVHIPVVLVPVAAIAALLIVIRPVWRRRFGWAVVALTAVSAVSVQLAFASGQSFRQRLQGNAEGPALNRHMELARQVRPIVVVFFLVLTAYVWFMSRYEAVRGSVNTPGSHSLAWSKAASWTLAALSALGALSALIWIVRTGHQGAKTTWGKLVG